jgi:Calcineurin-like phosphoesterase
MKMSRFWASTESESDSSRNSDIKGNDNSSLFNGDGSNHENEYGKSYGVAGKDDEMLNAKVSLTDVMGDPDDADLKWKDDMQDQVFAPVATSKSSARKEPNVTRIVCMSDTHARHRDIPFLPNGDILIHGGDFTKSGEMGSVRDLSDYFLEHLFQFQQIICIAGNHEVTFQPDFYKTARRRHNPIAFDPNETRAALKNCTYLEDSITTISIGGGNDDIRIYGSPWTVDFGDDWAFNLPRGEALASVWSKVPDSIDVLITHNPPWGRGDFTGRSGRAGCLDLLRHVQDRIRPRLHVSGHIHQGHGYSFDGHTVFVNASNLNSDTGIASRPCIVVDLPHDKSLPARIIQPTYDHVQTLGLLVEWLDLKGYYLIVSCVSVSQINDPNWSQQLTPLPDAFGNEASFLELCSLLELFHSKDARTLLRLALCRLYAECFS